jgi:2'-5' RNA ligase
MKRVFIAVKIDPDNLFAKVISSFKSGLKDENIKWTDSGNIHITLAFLGDTDEKSIEILRSKLKEHLNESGIFELKIKGAGVFKKLGTPKVIWAGIETSEKLDQLNLLVKRGVVESGVKTEDRPFKPHLTLGRIKLVNNITALKNLTERFRDTEFQKVSVTEVILYESILLQNGPVYKPIEKFEI